MKFYLEFCKILVCFFLGDLVRGKFVEDGVD